MSTLDKSRAPSRSSSLASLADHSRASDNQLADQKVLQWSPDRVAKWIAQIGFPAYDKIFSDNSISGDVLVHLNASHMKELGVSKIGHRLSILKAIHALKESSAVAFDCDDFVPYTRPTPPDVALESIVATLKTHSDLISRLSVAVEALNANLSTPRTDPTRLRNDPLPSPLSKYATNLKIYGRLGNKETEPYKSIVLNPNDTVAIVLQTALRRYKINEDFKCYGLFCVDRCLPYDEILYDTYSELVRLGNEPVVILTHLRTIPDVFRTSPHRSESSLSEFSPSFLDRRCSASSLLTPSLISAASISSEEDDVFCVFESIRAAFSIGDEIHVLGRQKGWVCCDLKGSSCWISKDCVASAHDCSVSGRLIFSYTAQGVKEVSVPKNEFVRIIQRIGHWMNVVFNDSRGWVPAAYISFTLLDVAPCSNLVPPTPLQFAQYSAQNNIKNSSPLRLETTPSKSLPSLK